MNASALNLHAAMVRLPGCLLVLMSAAFTIAYLSGCTLLDQAPVLVALALPVLVLAWQPRTAICDGLVERWFLLAIALLVWMAGVQYLRSDALPAGWLRIAERGAALALCLLVALSRVPTRDMIALLGASAALASVIAVLMDGLAGNLKQYYIGSFGLGQINLLCNTAGPAILAWSALQISDAVTGRGWRPRDAILATAGFAALLIIAILTRRRGVMVAMTCATLWPLGCWLYQRHRHLALALAGALAALLVILAVHLLSEDTPSLRNERISIYRCAVEAVGAAWPFGFGHYGILHVQQIQSEACRHFTACGGWTQQAHNEFLDVAVDGGPVALLVVLALALMAAYRLTRIRDPQVRLALQMLAIAVLIHLMTDNVFGLAPAEAWLGTVVGAMLAAPVSGPVLRRWRLLPLVPVVAALFTTLAAWGVWHQLQPTLLMRDAGIQPRLESLAASREPVIIDVQAKLLFAAAGPEISDGMVRDVVGTAVHLMGWTGALAVAQSDCEARAGHAQAETVALLRVLGMLPCYRQAYEELGRVISHNPECATAVPAEVQRRLAYLGGDRRLPAPNLAIAPRTMDDAIDAYASITWAIATGRPWPMIADALRTLCRRYGDIPGVAQLTLQAMEAAPAGSFPWLNEVYPAIEVGLRAGFDAGAYFAQAITLEQARAVMPLIQVRYPGVISDVGTRSMNEATESPELRNCLVRLIARCAPATHAP
jgi:hypothetical protein